jgi:hypothetical protein
MTEDDDIDGLGGELHIHSADWVPDWCTAEASVFPN